MRRRSPSPVVTGNVSRARMRFESGGSVKNNKTSPSPVPSGFEISSKYSLTGLEPLTSSQHQTLPRTFRFMNNNHNNTSSMDTIYRPDTKTTINKFLSGSSYANNINTVIIFIESISNMSVHSLWKFYYFSLRSQSWNILLAPGLLSSGQYFIMAVITRLVIIWTGLKSSYKCIILPFLVL